MAKTLKLKKPEPTLAAKPVLHLAEPGKEGDAAPAEEKKEGGGIYVSSRHRNPLEGGVAAVKKENWTWAAVLAILTTLLFVALCILEYMEFDFISKY